MRLFGRAKRAPRGLPTYWNESVVERIQGDAGVDRETARTWFNEMLVFLDMVADSKEFISPPEPVDVAWHASSSTRATTRPTAAIASAA